jgi:hypothetical protein
LTPATLPMTPLQAYLRDLDEHYDPGTGLPWSAAGGPGYHTRVPEGTRVHETRVAADYVIGLLLDGSPARVARAHDVMRALLDAQVTDPVAEHYGLWGWFLEEPPQQMAPADWNWADFIGVRLAHVLAAHGVLLEQELRREVEQALRHCAAAIFRRNVKATYSNIAVLGAVTTAAAGELLDDPHLLAYARRRLRSVEDLMRSQDGEHTEYTSPTYARVILEELERSALIVTDPQFAATAESLRELTWAALARRFHPGTRQLCGPMSRAYSDRLSPEHTEYLLAGRGEPLVPALLCPAHLADRFQRLPSDPCVTRTATGGTSWFTADACLGSAEEESGWTQRRPLLGYWRTEADPAVVLRARFLLNGRDLSAARCRQRQDGPRVLSAWRLSYGGGNFHPTLDKPEGSVYQVRDLRLRISLTGRDVRARALGDGQYVLSAGERCAQIFTTPATYLDQPVEWRLTEGPDEVHLDAVLYEGPEHDVDFHHAPIRAAFGLELRALGEEHAATPGPVAGDAGWSWGELRVDAPGTPTAAPR